MPPVSRAELLERYEALPLPDKNEEHWRFTDLKGFDPDTFGLGAGGTSRFPQTPSTRPLHGQAASPPGPRETAALAR